MTQDKENKIEISKLDTELNLPQNEGWQISKAPQAALTAPDDSALNTGSAVSDAVITNMRVRILELENALVKLNLIKSR